MPERQGNRRGVAGPLPEWAACPADAEILEIAALIV
jgi:hypothetical protein